MFYGAFGGSNPKKPIFHGPAMLAHPYHFELLRGLIRRKLKGDHRIPLSCADRLKLVTELGAKVAESYVTKVLSESNRNPRYLSQFVLDQLARTTGHADWNELLRKNPVPDGLYDRLMRPKARKLLYRSVEQRLQQLKLPEQEVRHSAP